MAKGKGFTEDDLTKLGLVEISPGKYQKKKTVLQPREVKPYEHVTGQQVAELTGTAKAEIVVGDDGWWNYKPEKKTVYFKNQDIKQVFAEAEERGYIYIPGNVPSLKNGKQIFKTKSGKPFISSSNLCKDYIANKKIHYTMFKSRFLKMIENKPFPITVRFIFIRDKHKAFDYGNINQIVLDCMTGSAYYPKKKNKIDNAKNNALRKAIAWIPDDDADHLVPEYAEGYGYDPKLAGVIIKVI